MSEYYDAQQMIEAFGRGEYALILQCAMPFAEAGISDAQCMIALLYQCGAGVPLDANEAVRWYRKAAEQNHPVAWCSLGTIYDSGLLGVPNEEEARRCYLRSHELGGPTNAKYVFNE